jgi:CBS domain-containing protein
LFEKTSSIRPVGKRRKRCTTRATRVRICATQILESSAAGTRFAGSRSGRKTGLGPPREESTMLIKEVMTARVSFVQPSTPIAEIARTLREDDIGSVPVVENDRLVGMITDRDIVLRIVAEETDLRTATARDAMSPRILYCFEDQTIDEVLDNMGENQIRRLPVIDRNKRLVGVVSLGDLSL